MKRYLKKEFMLPILAVVLAALILTGVSYAIFSVAKTGTKDNVVNAGTLELTFIDDTSSTISLDSAVPVTDATGMTGTAYTFTLKNTGTLPVYYKLKIEENEDLYTVHNDAGRIFGNDKLRLGFTKNATTSYIAYHRQDLDSGVLQAGESNTYTVRIWISYEAGNEVQGNHFHGTFVATGQQDPYPETEPSYFTFNTATGTITGYDAENGPKDIIIPTKIDNVEVQAIGEFAFAGKGLTSIEIPTTVTTIGTNAFVGNQFTKLTIPKSIISIGNSAFASNSSLTEVVIENGVTEIGTGAFSQDIALSKVTIPSSVTTINAGAFEGCGLTEFVIPSSIRSIGDSAFDGSQLTSVVISEGVTSIGAWAFARTSLTSVVIPNSVMNIGNQAFGANQLTSVTIKGKNSTADFESYTDPFGWADGYSDENITWQP